MTRERQSVLLIEDDTTMARVYAEYLAREPYDVVHVDTGKASLKELAANVADVVLLDLKLPDMDGFEILKAISSQQMPTEVIVITGQGSMNLAIQAMQLGARDFLVKPFSKERLICTLKNTLETGKLSRIVKTYREEIDRHEYCGFIGSSLAMQAVYRTIDSAGGSTATVFISGESGTGKEICAEAIHQKSAGADKPFIAINCGAIPKDLMESEIFGHVKGAFTGAIKDRDGAATLADGGTLFFDEICEMDLSLQPKLLRFIQSGKIQRVGSSVVESVDIRFICATNRDPLEEVTAGRFREDLFYRLHVLPIHLPALCEREGDVIDIARHFLGEYAKEEGKSFSTFAPQTEKIIQSYSWPGNVRQLQNVVRNIVVLNDGDIVTPAMLPPPIHQESGDQGVEKPVVSATEAEALPATPAEPAITSDTESGSVIRPLVEMEREAIEKAIKICDGNIPRAAHFLGISAATIYRKRAARKKLEEIAA